MIRVISIVLTAAIALQTARCAPNIRMSETPADYSQNQIRDLAPKLLKKGMEVTLIFGRKAPLSLSGRAVECVVEKVGPESLTVIVKRKYFARGADRLCEFRYSDILNIQIGKSNADNARIIYYILAAIGTVWLIFGAIF